MDDILSIIEKSEIDSKLNEINNLHPSLKFTIETESNGTLPFLDMLVHNVEGSLSSSWYRKPTDTGLTLNFHSLSPMKYKKSVIIGFVYRIYRACSSWEFIHLGLEQAKEILLANQYPSNLIEEIFNKTLHKIIENDSDSSEPTDLDKSVNLDPNCCLHNISEKDKFMFFVNYRGKPNEHFAQSLKRLNAPCKLIMTLNKTKAEV